MAPRLVWRRIGMDSPHTNAEDILTFWFAEIEPRQHWKKDSGFDQLIRERFAAVHAAASRCELYGWRTEPAGRLAEIIVLDQFSRNMFRNQPQAFAFDSLALALAQEAVFLGVDRQLPEDQVAFLYMPYMHSESPVIHQAAVRLFANTPNYEYELKHKAVIDRFGRYPHRNEILNRLSTAEEVEFLNGPHSRF